MQRFCLTFIPCTDTPISLWKRPMQCREFISCNDYKTSHLMIGIPYSLSSVYNHKKHGTRVGVGESTNVTTSVPGWSSNVATIPVGLTSFLAIWYNAKLCGTLLLQDTCSSPTERLHWNWTFTFPKGGLKPQPKSKMSLRLSLNLLLRPPVPPLLLQHMTPHKCGTLLWTSGYPTLWAPKIPLRRLDLRLSWNRRERKRNGGKKKHFEEEKEAGEEE